MTTKYKDVEKRIINQIETGVFYDGERLTSCRELAENLDINKITVNKAYSELERKHYVYSIPRGGFYVIGKKGATKVVTDTVDFSAVKPEGKLIPFRAFTHAMNNAIDLHKVKLFNENDPKGLLSLRKTLTERLASDGIYTKTENLLITHGSQQDIDLVLQLLFKETKKKLLIESPTYSLAIKRAQSLGVSIETIERSKEGLCLDTLETLLKTGEIKCFYIIPRYHNPTGYSLNEQQKKSIAKLCDKYGVWILEDDYLGDLGKTGEGLSIHYYDTSQQVIYLRSFSKTFMPGIRIGAMCCPEPLMRDLVALKKNIDLGTSILPQSALDIFIQSGMYDKHIQKIRVAYKRKLERSKKLLESTDTGDLIYSVPATGIFIWLEHVNEQELSQKIKKLEDQGIKMKTSESFYINGKGRNQIRLCISSVPEEKIYTIALILKIL